MIRTKTIKTEFFDYEFTAFYEFGQLGNIKIPIPGHLVYCQIRDTNTGETISAGFFQDKNGNRLRFKNADEAFDQAEKFIINK